ncbi:MAG: carboxypeptidase M32 [Thermoleophilia bacterium]|nr:carboxypeptidase M32 [Thermoleophilia bacterium]
MEQRFADLKQRLAEINDLSRAGSLLAWDQRVMMPPAAAAVRGEQLATVTSIVHERFTSPEVGRLLDELRPYEESLPYESDEASLIRVARRDFEKATRVPGELRGELARASASGYAAWQEARARADFELLRPALERNVELRHRYVECFAPYDDPYDPLLDDYEPGMHAAEVTEVFDVLKPELKAIVADVARRDPVEAGFLAGSFPVGEQRQFALRVLERFGFDPTSWRFDDTVHPFASSMATTDIRLTSRYKPDRFDGLFAAMHEWGHGIYEHGVDPALERTPLARGVSMALHESQSRLWENLVGRSRPFWRFFYPQLQEAFPEQFGSVDEEAFYRAVNRVEPSFIRVEADQVTYSLHIILRYELERELFSGALDVRNLPDAWNARMADYLGITVADDAQGVLQDVHWSGGGFGYFPTYALGNVVSLQVWERMLQDIADVDEQFARGEFRPLADWLREHLYRFGRKFTPKEALERVTGTALDPAPYIRYLRRKVAEIYGADETPATVTAGVS